jgi:hypothetical protein
VKIHLQTAWTRRSTLRAVLACILASAVAVIAAVAPPAALAAAGAPSLGQTLRVGRRSGTVLLRLPSSRRFARLRGARVVPLGSEINTLNGSVTITVARHPSGPLNNAEVAGGIFSVSQPHQADAFTTFTLTQSLSGCSTAARTQAQAARKKSGVKRRHITVSEHGGGWATHGQYVATSVEGTEWTTTDTCTSSIVTVESGVVEVTNLVSHATVTLHAHESYTAGPHQTQPPPVKPAPASEDTLTVTSAVGTPVDTENNQLAISFSVVDSDPITDDLAVYLVRAGASCQTSHEGVEAAAQRGELVSVVEAESLAFVLEGATNRPAGREPVNTTFSLSTGQPLQYTTVCAMLYLRTSTSGSETLASGQAAVTNG